jgi:hypothetical protein
MWGWQGLTNNKYLAVSTTGSSINGGALNVIVQGSNVDISPQTQINNNPVNFSISSGSNLVTIVDANSSATPFTTIYLNTPVAIGNLLLSGGYQVNAALGSSQYTILSSVAASTTITSSGLVPLFTVSSGSALVTVTLSNNNYTTTTGLYQQFIAPTTLGGITIQGPYLIASIIDSTSFKI